MHKLRNISNHCPRAIQASVVADAKRIIYATSKKEALEEFKAWKERYKNLAPKAIACLEKDLDDVLRFMDFRYKIWVSIRTTNIIERVFREFLKAYKYNGYISNRRILYQDNVLVSSVSKRKLGG